MDRILADPEIMGGAPCVAGTRIPVVTILGLLGEGMPPPEILSHYPQITIDDVSPASDTPRRHWIIHHRPADLTLERGGGALLVVGLRQIVRQFLQRGIGPPVRLGTPRA